MKLVGWFQYSVFSGCFLWLVGCAAGRKDVLTTPPAIEGLVKKKRENFSKSKKGEKINKKEIREMAERAFETLEAFFERRDFQNKF